MLTNSLFFVLIQMKYFQPAVHFQTNQTRKVRTVSDASHFLLEKISKAHKMSPAHTIYHIILIYGSQWTVGNGGGVRWRAYNILLYSELYIRRLYFFFLYTQLRHSLSSSLLQEKKKRKKEKSTYLYYIMFSKQQIPSANYLWVCSPSSGTCCIFWVPVFAISQCFCSAKPWMGPLWGAAR